jgi:gluconokinase
MTVATRPMLVMGVSGSGKSVLGQALGHRLGIPFVDADDLHPASNKARMAAGIPLTDAERIPWLGDVARTIARRLSLGHPTVVACSALKRVYRDLLRTYVPDLLVIYLDGSQETIQSRLSERQHEYMPASLLASQIADLEPPDADEAHIRISLDIPVEAAADLIVRTLHVPVVAAPQH